MLPTRPPGRMTHGMEQNATFVLHKDMMDHLDHVLAISLAERLGGKDGYSLLIASTKQHITIGFLNVMLLIVSSYYMLTDNLVLSAKT